MTEGAVAAVGRSTAVASFTPTPSVPVEDTSL